MASASSPARATDSAPVRIAQRYVVLAEIAHGGMGVVHKVEEIGTGTVLALKRIRVPDREGAGEPASEARLRVFQAAFEREYQVLASIDHPGIIRVFDYGVDGGQPYYTMEFVHGRDLRTYAPMPWRAACRHLRDVASALSLLHARRLVHRDLSPGNVKLSSEGRCKLLDFGALTDFGYSQWVVGTPPLIAPEAFEGGMLDQRVDLYALGALAYWLMTARHAYPAERLADLPACWRRVPPAPSSLEPTIPAAVDTLVMSLLSANPLARHGSAAEVISLLNAIAELEPEEERERQRLARSYLIAPPFVGRAEQIAAIQARLAASIDGHGAVLRIRGAAGSGRSRLLEEAAVRAQIAGATVLRVDASMQAIPYGTSRALTLRLLQARPELALEHGQHYQGALSALGPDVARQLGVSELRDASPGATADASGDGELSDWFLAICRAKPLVLQVDNVEYVDDVSLGLLARLAHAAPTHRLLLMFSERSDATGEPAKGLRTLRELSTPVDLPNLSSTEELAHVRAMFGDVPNVQRFAEWLHGRTAGNPLLSVGLSRQLVERGVLRYRDGLWELPVSLPVMEHSVLMDQVLSSRIERLSPAALELARALCLQSIGPTFALCVLIAGVDERATLLLLDELARRDVLQLEQGIYRFSSIALREVLLASTNQREREASHLRLGRALLQLGAGDATMRIEGGWHLIRGGCELEGADLITEENARAVGVRTLNANMYRVGPPVEAALHVVKRYRNDRYARLPLLCTLSQAGFLEDSRLDEQHADDALDMLEELCGVRMMRTLRFLGRHLALVLGMLFAVVRYHLLPKRSRPFKFTHLVGHLFATVLSGVAVAAIKLDGDRAARVANVIEPFTALPRSMTAPSIHRFCVGMQQIAREHQVEAFREFEDVLRRLDQLRAFRLVPGEARLFFVCAAHFARGAFAIFRDDGRAALESASFLTNSGLRMFAMVGSQLRYLYYVNRGELAQAAPHRAEVELHAAHFGSAWQVDTWEAAALLPVYLTFGDFSAVERLSRQLEVQGLSVRSLWRYARLAQLASHFSQTLPAIRSVIARAEPEVAQAVPRSFIGWSASVMVLARAHNWVGEPEKARAWCERALALMSDEDREYTALFLGVDIEAAKADAMLGRVDLALARIDGLIARFHESTNRMTLGTLHEARAQVCWDARRVDAYEASLAEVERWFGASQTPALIAKLERLVALQHPADTVPGIRLQAANDNQGAAQQDPDTEV